VKKSRQLALYACAALFNLVALRDAGAKELNGFLYRPPTADVHKGCDLKAEDNIADFAAAYIPESNQLYIRYVTVDASEKEGADAMHQETFWIVVTDGQTPDMYVKSAIIYADLKENRLVFYSYDGVNSEGFLDEAYIGTIDGAINIEEEDDKQVVSFLVDATPVNQLRPEASGWKGIRFGETAGMWMHTTFGAVMEYKELGDGAPVPPSAEMKKTFGLKKYDYHTSGVIGTHIDTGTFSGTLAFTVPADKDGKAAIEDVEEQALSGDLEPSTEKGALAAATEDDPDAKPEENPDAKEEGADDKKDKKKGKDKKRFSWCSLHDDLISNGALGIGNIGSTSVSGPKFGFIDVDTIDLPCLSALRLYVDTSEAVESVSVVVAGGEPVEMTLEEGDEKRFAKENGIKRFSVRNMDGPGNQLFRYGPNEFSLIFRIGGQEAKEDHELLIPRP
jgi:hypothetical protein